MIEADKRDDNERTTRARAVYAKNTGCEGAEGRDRRVYLRARPSTRFARTGAARLRGNTERASEAATWNARDTVGEKHRTRRPLGEDHPGQ